MESRIKVTNTDLPVVAQQLVDALPQCDGATVLALVGDLGSGKTTLVQHIASVLGVTEVVNSPTFVLQKIYDTPHDRFTTLIHIDMYRLQGAADASVLRLEYWARDPQVLLCVEWPERVDVWPESACVYTVTLTTRSETERDMQILGIVLPTTS